MGVAAISVGSRATGSTSHRGGSSDVVQPVELANAIVEQSPADRFFHKTECPLDLSRFGFSLLGAVFGRELLVRLGADIGLSLVKRPMGVLEFLVHCNHQFVIGTLRGLRSHLGLPHFLRSLPTQELCACLGLACPVLRGAKCVGCLIHEIKSGRALFRPRRRVGKLVNVPARKLIWPSPLLSHPTDTRY